MIFTFEKLPADVSELSGYSMQSPFETVALIVAALDTYSPQNENTCFEMLQYLMGGAEIQPLAPIRKSFIKDRFMQNKKYPYIAKSYMGGATPENGYTPDIPYTIEVKDNPYSYTEDGYAKLLLKSGGADSERPIMLRKMKTGRWVLWSDTVLGILSDIREPKKADDPWA